MVYLLNCSIVLLFIGILKLVMILGCLKNIINLDFSTLSSSIFDFNQVVIFDISVLILFSMFMGFYGCRRFQVLL